MSKHEYKFGDRAYFTDCDERVIVTEDDGDRVYAIFDDNSNGWHDKDDLTPGWPTPEGCVRVRAAVRALGRDDWKIYGDSDGDDNFWLLETEWEPMPDSTVVHFIEATVPLPKSVTVEGEVVG